MTPTLKTQGQIPNASLLFLHTLLHACPPLYCVYHQAGISPALEQSLVVWVWRGPPSPVAGMSGSRSPASHGKKANTAFRSRPGKLKTVSSPTWISNEWQPRSLQLLVSSGPEGISVEGFRLQRCYLLRIWKIKHGSPGSRMSPCRSQDPQAVAAKGLHAGSNIRLYE